MSQSHQRRLPVWALRTNGGAVLLFLYAPIILLVVFSFSASRIPGQWGGFTTEWYSTLFDDSRLQRTIWVSVRVALVSTLIATVLGTMAALALERFTFRGRRVFDALLYLPIIIPDVTMAVMMLMFFSQSFNVVDVVFGPVTLTASVSNKSNVTLGICLGSPVKGPPVICASIGNVLSVGVKA